MVRVGNRRSATESALIVGVAYATISINWVLFSDKFVQSLATSQAQLTRFHSYKGVAFVVLSSLVVYGLVYLTFQRLTKRNQRLTAVLLQLELLHRILRHNLRNNCNVISGYASLLEDHLDGDPARSLATIQQQNDRLIQLSHKSRYLRDFIEPSHDDIVVVDLVEVVSTQVEDARETYLDAVLTTNTSPEAKTHVHYRISEAVEELITNAIIHNSDPVPHVTVTVHTTTTAVRLTIADDGPGIPPVERRVIQQQYETPTKHSTGLGLTLVRLMTECSDGSIMISDSDAGGTAVTLTLPAATLRESSGWPILTGP